MYFSKSFQKYLPIFLILSAILFLYLATMLPSQAFHDSGELQTVVSTLSIAHPTGFPTYILIGKVFTIFFPFGEIAWRINLLSAIYSVATLFLFSLFLVNVTKNYLWSIVGILYLAFSLPFWNWAGIADTHSLDRLFLAVLIFLFFLLSNKWTKKNLFVFATTFGLGLGNHPLLIYSIPGFIVWYILLLTQKKVSLKLYNLVISLTGLLIGLLVYLYLPLSEYFGSPNFLSYSVLTWDGFYRHITGADFRGFMYQGGLRVVTVNAVSGLLKIDEYLGLVGALIGLIGLINGLYKYRAVTVSLVVMFFSFLIFATNYPTSDPSRYYLSFLSIYILFIGMGACSIYEIARKIILFTKLRKVESLLLLLLFLSLTTPALLLIQQNYKMVDRSKDYYVRDYSADIFKTLEPNSVIISWWNYTTPLWYRKYVLKERSDVIIINKGHEDWVKYVNLYIQNHPVYLVEKTKEVEDNYQIAQIRYVYKVLPKP